MGIFIGTSGDDMLSGTSVGDYLFGAAGNDYLSGGAGADTLSGGLGDDTLYADDDDVALDGGYGYDVLRITVGTSLTALDYARFEAV